MSGFSIFLNRKLEAAIKYLSVFIKCASFNIENRNWTTEEINLFCEILLEPVLEPVNDNFKKRSSKKASTQEFSEDIFRVSQEVLHEPVFTGKKQASPQK